MGKGTWLWTWDTRWTGKTTSMIIHQERMGLSINAAISNEFGAHNTEMGSGAKVSAKPNFEPR